jgi:hypothetical protein
MQALRPGGRRDLEAISLPKDFPRDAMGRSTKARALGLKGCTTYRAGTARGRSSVRRRRTLLQIA